MRLTTKETLTESLNGRGPDVTLPTNREPDGRGPAILYADVSKSMHLHERLGDRAARVVIDRLLALATRAVKAHGGRVVKNIGDEILAILPHADAAARASSELMRDVAALKPQGGVVVDMHVGFHSGAYSERDGEITGDAVNIAKRLTAYAQSGQILTTSVSAGAISALLRRAMRRLGPLDIRGRREPIEVEEIAWRSKGDDETTFTPASLWTANGVSSRLVLSLGGRQWIVGPQVRHLAIGRDPGSDIVIRASQASRNHGFIEYRNGGFFYEDRSLNGSYVSFANSGESLLQRDQVLLSGQGMIFFGHPANDEDEPLAFRIDVAEH